MLPAFVRLTLTIAAVLIGLFMLVFVLKVLVIAAVLAALAIGGMVVVGMVRRRFRGDRRTQVMTLTARR